MRAVHVQALTGLEGLAVVEVPEAEGGASAGRIVIDVEAAGVSIADLLMSQGLYQSKSKAPFIPAGRVRSAPAESGLEPGDRVCAITAGAFAEASVGQPGRIFPLPEPLTFADRSAVGKVVLQVR